MAVTNLTLIARLLTVFHKFCRRIALIYLGGGQPCENDVLINRFGKCLCFH